MSIKIDYIMRFRCFCILGRQAVARGARPLSLLARQYRFTFISNLILSLDNIDLPLLVISFFRSTRPRPASQKKRAS